MNQKQLEALLQSTPPFLPMGKKSLNEKLNPDWAFLLWLNCHSAARAAVYLKSIGVTSYHDKPYTRVAIHLAATHSHYYTEARAKALDKHARLVRRIRDDCKKGIK